VNARRVFLRLAAGVGIAVLVVAIAAGAWAWKSSLLPDSYNVMDYGTLDYGGGPVPAAATPATHAGHVHGGVSVAALHGPAGKPDVRFRLVARKATVRLPSGKEVDALTFGGTVPGPELRAHRGDLVEVTLVNRDVEPGVTIHWHGVDVPNAEDGVAGVTQDAVAPGAEYTYRFRASQTGTFWYHSHESSSSQVRAGLFGAFVIEPREAPAGRTLDLSVVAHELGGVETLDGRDGLTRRTVAPGTRVRLRLVDTDNAPTPFAVSGSPFRVVAIDGTDLNDPGLVTDHPTLRVAPGGRFDVELTMPASPVALRVDGTPATLLLTSDGSGEAPVEEAGADFDPLAYGKPAPTPFDASSAFDRRFTLTIGRKPGFLDGHPGMQWTLNGGIYPDVPMLMVERGDLVELTLVNDTSTVHPMHLHGHHALVLSRDGEPARGTPWWTDTLDVEPGAHYVVAFRADNPGLWMEHCHNLNHAAAGLTMHLAYVGVTTPFVTGGDAHNHPE
jgi:FtsP/CotA-like multicopper oxidase with cupredoxin domain